MSVGPLGGLVGSAAGAPISQTAGGETERTQRDAAVQSREAHAAERAERAAGIGTTEQDQEATERDADGRRLWEAPAEKQKTAAADDPPANPSRQSKDATGQCGNHLDLTG
jgi:hypothetical protein